MGTPMPLHRVIAFDPITRKFVYFQSKQKKTSSSWATFNAIGRFFLVRSPCQQIQYCSTFVLLYQKSLRVSIKQMSYMIKNSKFSILIQSRHITLYVDEFYRHLDLATNINSVAIRKFMLGNLHYITFLIYREILWFLHLSAVIKN